jgi:hypothetical protein
MGVKINSLIAFFTLIISVGCTPQKKEEIRILVAGIRHESNSFMPGLTSADDFILLRDSTITRGRAWASFLFLMWKEFWMPAFL